MRLTHTLAILVACTVLAAEDTPSFTIRDTVDLSGGQRHVVNDLDVEGGRRGFLGAGYRYMELDGSALELHELELRGGYTFVRDDRSVLRAGVGIRGRFDEGSDRATSVDTSTTTTSSTNGVHKASSGLNRPWAPALSAYWLIL